MPLAELLERLPDSLEAVLRTAGQIIAARSAARTKTGLDSLSEAKEVVDLLTKVSALRQGVRVSLAKAGVVLLAAGPVTDHDGLASALLSEDDPAAARAAAVQAANLLEEARRTLRHDKRVAKKAPRLTSAERNARRELDQQNQLRQARDMYRGRSEQLQQTLDVTRADLEQARADLEQAEGTADGARRQVERLRSAQTLPEIAAQNFLASLARAADADLAAAGNPSQDVDLSAARRGAGLDDVDLDELLAEAAVVGPFEVRDSHLLTDAVAAVADDLGPAAATARVWLPKLLDAIAHPPTPVFTNDLALRVDVLGGGDEIGGSCILITAGGTRILVDAGSRPKGNSAATMGPPGLERAYDGRIDAIVLTHAHNDHCGMVPAILAKRPETPVFATPATCDLLNTMWRDSAKVLSRRADAEDGPWTGRAPYGLVDVERAVSALNETPINRPLSIGSLKIELFPAGHIVGAAGVVVTAGDKRVVVTGDVSKAGQATVGGIALPQAALGADLMLLESTYAGAHHVQTRKNASAEFVREITRVVDRGGVALVPSFALGRAQEVALLCREHLPDVPVLVDGLARDVSEVFERHHGPDKQPLQIFGRNVSRVRGGTQTAIRTFRSGVVIATSGMLTQGPAVAWAERVLPDPNSALMVVGYQDEESPGAKLMRLAEDHGGGTFRLQVMGGDMVDVPVNARVAKFGLGAHANADELASIAAEAAARHVMLVHGEPDGQLDLAQRLRRRSQSTLMAGRWS